MRIPDEVIEEVRKAGVINRYHIVYPGGDRSKLTVVGFSAATYYELGQYDLASRRQLETQEEAAAYAAQLAVRYGLTFVGDTVEPAYLD